MIHWQTILSLLIVAAAVMQLVRLLFFGKKNGCGHCRSGGCSSLQNQNAKQTIVELDDFRKKNS